MLPTVKLNIQTCAKPFNGRLIVCNGANIFRITFQIERYLTQPHPAFQLANWPEPEPREPS